MGKGKRDSLGIVMAGLILMLILAGCQGGGSSSSNVDLTGDWNFHFLITAAGGVCSGDVGS